MIHTIINCIGLIFGIIGTRLIWKYGLPETIDRRGFVTRITDDVDKSQIELGKLYDARLILGLRLLMWSFALQFASNLIPC